MRPGETSENVTFVDIGFKKWKDMIFLERLTLLEISEIDKFKFLKVFIYTFSISLSLFLEPIYNNANY